MNPYLQFSWTAATHQNKKQNRILNKLPFLFPPQTLVRPWPAAFVWINCIYCMCPGCKAIMIITGCGCIVLNMALFFLLSHNAKCLNVISGQFSEQINFERLKMINFVCIPAVDQWATVVLGLCSYTLILASFVTWWLFWIHFYISKVFSWLTSTWSYSNYK